MLIIQESRFLIRICFTKFDSLYTNLKNVFMEYLRRKKKEK